MFALPFKNCSESVDHNNGNVSVLLSLRAAISRQSETSNDCYSSDLNCLTVCPGLVESISSYDIHGHDSQSDQDVHSRISSEVSAVDCYTGSEFCREKQLIYHAKIMLQACLSTSLELNQYHLTRLLGFGTFGIVVEATMPGRSDPVAIKIMNKSSIHPNRFCTDPHTLATTSLEILLLKHCPPSENIIAFVDSWEDADNVFLVTEVAGHSWDLETIDSVSGLPTCCVYRCVPEVNRCDPFEIWEVNSCFTSHTHCIEIPGTSTDRSSAGLLRLYGGLNPDGCRYRDGTPLMPAQIQKRIFRQLARCLLFLHHSGITHKDIKDENVMLDSQLNLRLIDFGHAALFTSSTSAEHKKFSTYGTPVFSPPEVHSGLVFDGPSADIYAMGLMMYEHHFGDVPVNFDAVECFDGAECIFEFSPRTGFTDPDAIDLVRWMLQPDPRKRATVEDIVAHAYLYSNDDA
eukprot:Partr_v1_DN26563_c2_g1_i1_m3476 putative PAS domain containing serine threonine kinase